jgi:hypothetical protein
MKTTHKQQTTCIMLLVLMPKQHYQQLQTVVIKENTLLTNVGMVTPSITQLEHTLKNHQIAHTSAPPIHRPPEGLLKRH